jgi:hypothetical protein
MFFVGEVYMQMGHGRISSSEYIYRCASVYPIITDEYRAAAVAPTLYQS